MPVVEEQLEGAVQAPVQTGVLSQLGGGTGAVMVTVVISAGPQATKPEDNEGLPEHAAPDEL